MDRSDIPGYGVDADFSRRPGVPMLRTPRPTPNAQVPPPEQHSRVRQLAPKGREYPPVWGTAQPPRGLAGLMRRAAYRYPDHLARHWAGLLAADRVDVWEHRVRKLLPFIAAGAGLFLLARASGRRSR